MRRRNREILIFSLSAIDLFCAGMGAVMVLMVLLMPYYQRPPEAAVPEEPEPVAIVEPAPPIPAPPIPKPPEPEPEPVPPAPVPEPGLQISAVDVVFVMDATSSMKDELDAVRSGLKSIVQVLRRLTDDVTVGFVAYKDIGVLWSWDLRTVKRGFAGDANLRGLLRGMGNIKLDPGEDWPEDVNAGLVRALSMGWPAPGDERRQVVVLIGDAETHVRDRERSLRIVRKWVDVSEKRSLHGVNTCPEIPELKGIFEETRRYFKRVAEAGNGDYFEDHEDVLGSILDILIVR